MDIKAVIFDFDGTMVDSFGIWNDVINPELCRNHGVEGAVINPKELGGMSFTGATEYIKNKYNLDGNLDDLVRERREIGLYHFKNTVKLKPGVKEFIELAANSGVELAIASGNTTDIILSTLEGNGISKYFNTIFTSCEVKRPKPFPDVFLSTAAKLGVEPSNCLVFEDMLEGVLAAKTAGMKVYAVFEKEVDYQLDSIKENCDRYIQSFYEVFDLFEKKIAG